ENEPSFVRRWGGQDGGDDSALVMADEADFFGVDFFPRLQIGEGNGRVAGEVLRGSLIELAGGLANAALVVAKNGDALACEVVGQNQKGAMAGNVFVAIVRTRACDKNRGRKWTAAGRKGQRTGE